MKIAFLFSALYVYATGIFAQTYDTLKTFVLPNQYACGVIFDKDSGRYIIATAGAYATFGDETFAHYDLNGNFISSQPQTGVDLIGYREIESDSNYIYGGNGSYIYKLNKNTYAQIDTITSPITSPAVNRGLALESNGTIWVTDVNKPLYHLTSTGSVIESCPETSYNGNAFWGIAIDTLTKPGKKFIWMAAPGNTSATGVLLVRYNIDSCKIDTTVNITSKVPGYTGTNSSAGLAAGLSIINNHPDYPGKIIALFVSRRNGGNSAVMLIDITPVPSSGVQENTMTGNAVQLFPNPFSSSATFLLDSNLSIMNAELKIFDALGNEVQKISGIKSQTDIKKGDLSNGMYFYKLTERNATIGTGKFIIH